MTKGYSCGEYGSQRSRNHTLFLETAERLADEHASQYSLNRSATDKVAKPPSKGGFGAQPAPDPNGWNLMAALGLTTGRDAGLAVGATLDLGADQLRVESLEQTREGFRFTSPKTRYGQWTISLPGWMVADLRAHRAKQEEHRRDLELGLAPTDDLIFANGDGAPRNPDARSRNWARALNQLQLSKVTLHATAYACVPTHRVRHGCVDDKPAARAWFARHHVGAPMTGCKGDGRGIRNRSIRVGEIFRWKSGGKS